MEEVKCPFCEMYIKKENMKGNTHYLTDGIIRSAINHDSSNVRDRGVYFQSYDDSGSIEIKFQRDSTEEFEKVAGREPNSAEINEAKFTNGFSVDGVFCKNCEIKFEKIETKFQFDVSTKLREKISVLSPKNSNLIRIFFLLQIWRSSIVECEYDFKLSSNVEKELRDILWKYVSILLLEETLKKIKKDRSKTSEQLKEQIKEKEEEIFEQNNKISKRHPLIIHFLETIDGKFNENHVICLAEKNPFTILMNDFIVQFYESKETLKYSDLYGLNDLDFQNEANIMETNFKINIKSNSVRKEYLKKIGREKALNQGLKVIRDFERVWNNRFGVYPSEYIISAYFKTVIDSANFIYGNEDFKMIDFSEDKTQNRIDEFIKKFIENDEKPALV